MLAPRTFLRCCAPDDHERGELGERLAARWLRRRGWKVLGRRVPSPYGEIDLVALERGVLVVVEVKTGVLGPRYRPGMRVSARDVRRLRAALGSLGARGSGRVDLVEVLLGARGELAGFEHRRDLRRAPFPPGVRPHR